MGVGSPGAGDLGNGRLPFPSSSGEAARRRSPCRTAKPAARSAGRFANAHRASTQDRDADARRPRSHVGELWCNARRRRRCTEADRKSQVLHPGHHVGRIRVDRLHPQRYGLETGASRGDAAYPSHSQDRGLTLLRESRSGHLQRPGMPATRRWECQRASESLIRPGSFRRWSP